MSDLFRWFGEQSETVKLTLLGMLSGMGLFVGAILKEWRKPVLTAVPNNTTATAPSSSDDPTLLLLAEVSAINVNLGLLLNATKSQIEAQDNRIDKVLGAITELAHQVERLRDMLNITLKD